MEEWRSAGLNAGDRITGLVYLKPYKVAMNAAILLSSLWLCIHFAGKRKAPLAAALVIIGLLLWLCSAPNYRFLLAFVMAAGILAPVWEPDKAWLRAVGFVLPLFGMLFMNTLGLRELRIIRCGEPRPTSWLQLWQPVAYPSVAFEERQEEEGWSSVVPGDCIHCGQVPAPCYPDTVRNYNTHHGWELGKMEKGFILRRNDGSHELRGRSSQ
jgi:hypothetical protein